MSIHVSDIGPRAALFTPRPTATPHNAAMAAQVLDAQLYTDAAQARVLLKGVAERLKSQPQREGQAFMAAEAHKAVEDLIASLNL